jgi:hypothetical protein
MITRGDFLGTLVALFRLPVTLQEVLLVPVLLLQRNNLWVVPKDRWPFLKASLFSGPSKVAKEAGYLITRVKAMRCGQSWLNEQAPRLLLFFRLRGNLVQLQFLPVVVQLQLFKQLTRNTKHYFLSTAEHLAFSS